VISAKTEEGAQLGSLGSIGALLRFKPSHWTSAYIVMSLVCLNTL
jgi:hypothetical protein